MSVETLSPVEATELSEAGFARYGAEDFRKRVAEYDADRLLEELQGQFVGMPSDPYAPNANRYRRYGRAVYVPWSGNLTWLPPVQDAELGEATEYFQGDFNPEFRGARRRFPAVPAEARANELLRQIILFDAEQALWLDELRDGPVHIGIHFLTLRVEEAGERAVPSPDFLHQDGERFTFAHLINRDNVVGGVNVIAPPRCAGMKPEEISPDLRQAEFTLESPLDSYAVYDEKVSHYVSPVCRGDEPRPGERAILLIDFTPYIPHI
jgi:hypothetical protein